MGWLIGLFVIGYVLGDMMSKLDDGSCSGTAMGVVEPTAEEYADMESKRPYPPAKPATTEWFAAWAKQK